MPAVGAISASVNFDVSQFIANAKKMSSEALKSFAGIKETADNTNKTLGGLNSTLAKLNLQLQNVQIGSKEFKSLQAEIKKTQAELDKASNSGGKFQDAMGAISSGIAAAGVMSLGKAVLTTAGTFEKYNAILKNTLGTQEEATAAMKLIKDFAASTPYSVDELTASFIKFANRGLKLTREELTAFGDTAASQGKSFDQYTEAVLDALGSETERLKEFGIKSTKVGDSISFTFKGVTKTVKNSSEEIKGALLEIGKMEGVKGGMDAISKTWEGTLSNMGDTIDNLKETIGNAILPIMKELVLAVSWVISKFTEWAKENPNLFNTLVIVTGAVSLAVTTFIALQGAMTVILPILAALKASIIAVGTAMLANPIGLAIAAIAVSLLLVITYWDEFKLAILAVAESMRDILDPLADMVEFIGVIVEEIKTFFAIMRTGESIFQPIIDWVAEIFEGFKDWNLALVAFKVVLAPIIIPIQSIIFAVKTILAGWQSIWGVLKTVYQELKPLLDIILRIATLDFKMFENFDIEEIKTSIINGFVSVYNSILAMGKQFWEKFKKAAKDAVQAVKDFFSGNVTAKPKEEGAIFAPTQASGKKGGAKPMAPVASGGKPLKEDSGVSELQPIFARVKENVGGIADQKGTIKLIADLKSQLKDIEQSSVLFGSKFQQSLASVAVKIKAVGAVMQEFGKAFTDILAATAQLKQVKFDNFKQNLSFVANAMSKLVDDGLKATIDSINAETNARAKGYDEQLAAFTDAKKKEQDAQKEHDLQMQLLKAEMDAKAKAENDALFQEQAEKLNAEYQAQIDQINAQTTNATEAAASEQALLAQQEEAKIALRQQFDQRLIEQQDLNKQTIDEKNAAYDAERKAREEKADKDKQAIEEAKQTFLAEQENKRTQAQDRAAKEKEAIQKRTALIEWQVGKGAFEANKQSQRAAIQMNMGMMLVNAAAGVLAAFAQGGIPGAIIGGIMAGALTGLGLAATATSLAAVSAAQYPPPPVFAEGGIVPGSSFSGDKVPAMVNSGEMILNQSQQAKLFEQANGKGGGVGTTNIYLDGVKVQNMTNASPDMIADQVGRIIRQSTYQAVTR